MKGLAMILMRRDHRRRVTPPAATRLSIQPHAVDAIIHLQTVLEQLGNGSGMLDRAG